MARRSTFGPESRSMKCSARPRTWTRMRGNGISTTPHRECIAPVRLVNLRNGNPFPSGYPLKHGDLECIAPILLRKHAKRNSFSFEVPYETWCDALPAGTSEAVLVIQ